MLRWVKKKTHKLSQSSNLPSIEHSQNEESPSEPTCPPDIFKIFGIHLITDKIFGNLSLEDLKSCRLVHTSWTPLITHYILQHSLSYVSIEYHYMRSLYIKNPINARYDRRTAALNDKLTTQNLNKVLENSTLFPSTTFHLTGVNLANPDILHFFQLQAEAICALKLHKTTFEHCIENPKSYPFPKSLFFRRRVDQLKRTQFQSKGQCTHILPPLPSLVSLAWSGKSWKAVKEILKMSTNLTVIPYSDFPRDLPVLIKSGKIHLIQNLRINPTTCTPDDLSALTRAGSFSLTQLTCIDYHSRWGEEWLDQFYTFVKVTSDTLTCMSWPQDKISLENVRTTFPRLTYLKPYNDFPARITLGVTFPNLMTLDLSMMQCKVDDPDSDLLPRRNFCGLIENVKTISINPLTSLTWFERLRELCPNFRNLILRSGVEGHDGAEENENLHVILPRIFRLWPHLQRIELIVNNQGEYNIECLDAAFSGFSKANCVRLNGQFRTMKDRSHLRNLMRAGYRYPEKLDNLKIQPGLCDLQELKELNVHFIGDRGYKETRTAFPITWITGFFSFELEMCSSAKVNLIYHSQTEFLEDLRQHHADILPYITVRCEYSPLPDYYNLVNTIYK